MNRHYFNMTNQPIQYRTWILAVESLTEADFKWLKAFDIPIRIEDDTQWFDTPKGRYKYQGKHTITLDTTTDKQQAMLVLKYGNDAILMSEQIVFPGDMSSIRFGGVTYK